jgi:ATP-dependent DNA ligase
MFFIDPTFPKIASPPVGDAWIREVKIDGSCVQIHKLPDFVEMYTKGGHRCSRRFEPLGPRRHPTVARGLTVLREQC